MPLPFIHLTIAVGVLSADVEPQSVELSDHGQYFLGALAPDSIQMREGADRNDKRRVHLFDEGKSLSRRFDAIEDLRARAQGRVTPQFLAAHGLSRSRCRYA